MLLHQDDIAAVDGGIAGQYWIKLEHRKGWLAFDEDVFVVVVMMIVLFLRQTLPVSCPLEGEPFRIVIGKRKAGDQIAEENVRLVDDCFGDRGKGGDSDAI